MSIDTVLYALTDVRIRIVHNRADWYREGNMARMEQMLGRLRITLMREDIASFDGLVDEFLENEPDLADEILEELFLELECDTRDDLSAKLLEA